MDMDISTDIHAKSLDMDIDMDEKFHIHDNPEITSNQQPFWAVKLLEMLTFYHRFFKIRLEHKVKVKLGYIIVLSKLSLI